MVNIAEWLVLTLILDPLKAFHEIATDINNEGPANFKGVKCNTIIDVYHIV